MYWATVPRADPNAKARQFRLNSALSPQRVLQSHAANESSGFGVGRFAARFTGASRPPSPMGLQTDAMPSDDSIRLDDDEMVTPIREPAADQNPESTVRVANLRSHLAPLQNDELLAQTQIFSHQTRLGFDGGGEAAGKETDHILIVFRLLQSDQRFSIDPRSMSLPDNIFAPYSAKIPSGGELPLQARPVRTRRRVTPVPGCRESLPKVPADRIFCVLQVRPVGEAALSPLHGEPSPIPAACRAGATSPAVCSAGVD